MSHIKNIWGTKAPLCEVLYTAWVCCSCIWKSEMDRLPRETRIQVYYNSLQSIFPLLQTFTHPQTRLTGPERCHIELEDNMGCGVRKGQSRKKMSVNFCWSTWPQEFLSSFMEPLIRNCEQRESMLQFCWLVQQLKNYVKTAKNRDREYEPILSGTWIWISVPWEVGRKTVTGPILRESRNWVRRETSKHKLSWNWVLLRYGKQRLKIEEAWGNLGLVEVGCSPKERQTVELIVYGRDKQQNLTRTVS